jgi:hypothetical protein
VLQLAAEAIECMYNLAPPDPRRVKVLAEWHSSASSILSSAFASRPGDTVASNGETRYRERLAELRRKALVLLAHQAHDCARDAACARRVRSAARVALALLAYGWPSDVPARDHVLGLLEQAASEPDLTTRQRSFLRSALSDDLRSDHERSERVLVRRARDLLSRAEADVRRLSHAGPARQQQRAPRRQPAPFEVGVLSGERHLTIMLPGRPAPSALEYENGRRIARVAHDSGPGRIIVAAATGARLPQVSKDDRSRARKAIRRTCKTDLVLKVSGASAEFSRPVTLSPALRKLV